MNSLTHLACLLVWLLGCNLWAAALAEQPPLLHPLFCDHAVLQRDIRVPVWGWTAPGARVTVRFAGRECIAVADADGKWRAQLKPMPASVEPRALTVFSSADDQAITTIKDVLVGDVWLCSGQSNMELGIMRCEATNDIVTANFPNLRLLTVPHCVSAVPVPTLACSWLPCSPDTIKDGGGSGFSATAFYFGRDLQRDLNIPIGLIHSSWGGTIAEAWMSAEGLKPLGDFHDALDWVRETAGSLKGRTYEQAYEGWCLRHEKGTELGWQNLTADLAGWKTVPMPQPFEKIGLERFDGFAWFRHEFELPSEWAGKELRLDLGAIDDYDTTWLNGVQVGQTYRPDRDRTYVIPAGVACAGRNMVTIRVLDTGGHGGLMAKPDKMRILVAGDQQAQPVPLAGEWQMRSSLSFSQLTAPPPPRDSANPNYSTFLYNGMIAPLVPFAIKGAIWYQGEANADRGHQYRRLLPALIADWRTRFGAGDFPFYIVSLAAFQTNNRAPVDASWAELREAQAMTAKNVKHSGLAVTIDIGEAANIHPKDKYDVGHRLALNALAQTYGKKLEYSGPWYRSMKIKGHAIRLRFDHVDGGLKAKGDRLTGFAIAGIDKRFVWADAVIEGDSIVVSSPEILEPVAVRYAWDTNPVCNLFNRAGLPAVPFRTDDWPGITR